jgi:hypothetical protein
MDVDHVRRGAAGLAGVLPPLPYDTIEVTNSEAPRQADGDRIAVLGEYVGIVAWLAIGALAVVSKTPLTYDEPFYLAPVAAFQQHGLSFAAVANFPQVTGIIHAAIQWIAAPLTGLAIPGVRVVNTVVMACAVGGVSLLLTTAAPGSRRFALRLLALPPAWVVTGMALTEPAAILLVALSFAALYGSQRSRSTANGLAFAAGGGVIFAAAVLAKQTALATVGGVAWLALVRPEWRPRALTFVLCAVAILLPVFAAWGGLAPPIATQLQVGVFSPLHALYAFAYGAVFSMIVARGFFKGQLKTAMLLLLVAALFNLSIRVITLRPFASAANRLLSGLALQAYDQVAGAILIALAVLFIVTTVVRFKQRGSDPIWGSATVGLMLGLASCGAVTYSFSGRYLLILSPLLLVMLLPYRQLDRATAAWLVLGHIAGAITLLAYLRYLPL